MSRSLSTIAPLAIAVTCAFIDAAPLVLVRDGTATSVIVTCDEPLDVQLDAAQELQAHLELMSTASVPIVRESDFRRAAGHALILVGQSTLVTDCGVDTTALAPETLVVKTVGDALILAGEDGRTAKTTRGGTLHAVYDFLQDQLGCRWTWPGDIGRYVPRRDTVTVQELDILETPIVKRRHVRGTLQEKHRAAYDENRLERFFDMGDTYRQLGEEEKRWMLRMRMGRSSYFKYGHAFTNWWERHKDASPDLFALQPNGRRGPRKSKRPDFVKMCVSNPKLWALQLAAYRRGFRKGSENKFVNACENDGSGGFCNCPRCRAWDADPDIEMEALPPVEDGSDVEAGADGDQPSPLPACLSDRYARWYNELARGVREIDPDGKVIAYAYSRYRDAPSKVSRIEPNVWIGYVGFNAYPRSAEQLRAEVDNWFGWSNRGATVFLRSNSLYYAGEGAPFVFARDLAEDTRFQLANGMRATDYDCVQGLWATSGPSYYVLSRMLWDTDADIDHLLDEFYSAFGPLAHVVREYFDYWETFTRKLASHPKFAGQRRPDRLRAYPELYAASLDEGYEILRKARSLWKEAAEADRERFRNILLGHKHGRLLVDALASGATGKGEAGRALLDFRREIAARNVVNVYWTTYKEIRYRVFE